MVDFELRLTNSAPKLGSLPLTYSASDNDSYGFWFFVAWFRVYAAWRALSSLGLGRSLIRRLNPEAAFYLTSSPVFKAAIETPTSS